MKPMQTKMRALLACLAASLVLTACTDATSDRPVDIQANAGDTVAVHYTGWFFDPAAPDGRGQQFDSSVGSESPLVFALGTGRVIKGWDQGIEGMNVGETKILKIPPELAYGERGKGGIIPPNATLLFEVKLMEVK